MSSPPQALANLPPEWPEPLLPQIRQQVVGKAQTIVVLDDDPTGTQTVYDTPVLTDWSVSVLVEEFERQTPLVYILTNTRGYPATEARRINEEIARALLQASRQTNRAVTVISRSDSTLRGHYPLETDVLAESLNQQDAVCLIIPFFLEGGRLTLEDVHYVVEGDQWTPAAQTPFAQDAVFGFRSSHLKEWVEEKTGRRVEASAVSSVDLVTIREKGPEGVASILTKMPSGSVGVVNALTMRDIEVVVAGILLAEETGKRFLYRTAASFVRARAGLAKRALLERHDMVREDVETRGGLVIVGSHVPKTTSQLKCLLDAGKLKAIEVNVTRLISGAPLEEIVADIRATLSGGQSVVVYTSRELITAASDEENLRISQAVSAALVDLVKRLDKAPRYIIAKGGITSSDVATKGLSVRRAIVLGQILPGIPVWAPGEEARFPGIPYVVFPGNVGGNEALLEAVNKLEGTSP